MIKAKKGKVFEKVKVHKKGKKVLKKEKTRNIKTSTLKDLRFLVRENKESEKNIEDIKENLNGENIENSTNRLLTKVSLDVRPVGRPLLEVELSNNFRRENNKEEYKAVDMNRDYSLNQKYELTEAGKSYDEMIPKKIMASNQPFYDHSFQEQIPSLFHQGSAGFQQSSSYDRVNREKKYESGLEQEARKRIAERRKI